MMCDGSLYIMIAIIYKDIKYNIIFINIKIVKSKIKQQQRKYLI
jgi:hypothetical protein